MKQYVACILFDKYLSKAMLIRKSRPKWMKGKLNGIGGHIEYKESPFNAIQREFTEKTGLINPKWTQFAILTGIDNEHNLFKVYWFTATVDQPDDWRATNPDNEPVNWYLLIDDTHSIVDNNMIPNLKWLIEMAKTHIKGEDIATCYHIQEMYIPKST